MINIEQLWIKIKQRDFPGVSGEEEERRMKVTFIQGMQCMRFLLVERVMGMSDKVATQALIDLQQQMNAEMDRLGFCRPAKQTTPKVVASIDGQRIKDN